MANDELMVGRARIAAALTAMLPEGDAAQQIDAILDRPDLEGYIEALDARVFYQLIHDAGWEQAVDLLPYATPSQIQCFFDLDVWRGDRLVPTRLNRWLEALVNDAPDEQLQKVCRELDPEILALYFKTNVEVYETEEGQIPDWLPMHAKTSPDGVYAIVFMGEDEDTFGIMWGLLLRLYELDRVLAWTLLEAARWEMVSDMEEHALRWRTARMEELGFVSRDEAYASYKWLDPARTLARLEAGELGGWRGVTAPEALDMPAVMRSELGEEFFIVRVMERVEDTGALSAMLYELMVLQNRVMLADGMEAGELAAGREVIRRTMGYASVGLEYLARGEEARGVEVMEVVPIRDLFRVGFTMVAQLQKQARQLITRPTLTLVDDAPHGLAGEADVALLESLLRQRPTWARDEATFDIFRAQEQVDEAALRLGKLAFKQLWLFVLQGATPDALVDLVSGGDTITGPEQLSIDLLFATWVGSALVRGGRGDCKRPLTLAELPQLSAALRAAPWAAAGAHAHFHELLDEVATRVPGAGRRLMGMWLDETLARLVDEFAPVTEWAEVLPAAGVVLV
jgi:hypothetical protein